MAAIISRITREKRARELKSVHQLKSSHCPFVLQQFKETFKPEEDNKFIKHRRLVKAAEDVQKKYQNLAEKKFEMQKKVGITKWTFWIELSILTFSLSLVPALVLFILFFWPPDNLPDGGEVDR